MTHLDSIVRFLNAHNVCGGRRTVVSADAKGIVVRSLEGINEPLVEVHETIKPTLQAARDWLGY